MTVQAPNGVVTVNGTVMANGAAAQRSGGGAGGGIYINCLTFSGGSNGMLSATGGTASVSGGGGGGGRIAVWAGVPQAAQNQYLRGNTSKVISASTNALFFGTTSVTNGTGNYTTGTNASQVGTVWFFTSRPNNGVVFFVF